MNETSWRKYSKAFCENMKANLAINLDDLAISTEDMAELERNLRERNSNIIEQNNERREDFKEKNPKLLKCLAEQLLNNMAIEILQYIAAECRIVKEVAKDKYGEAIEAVYSRLHFHDKYVLAMWSLNSADINWVPIEMDGDCFRDARSMLFRTKLNYMP